MSRTRPLAAWPRLAAVTLLLAFASQLHAQRSRKTAVRVMSAEETRVAIDSFVVTVRDMAAWALVTPAAHIPVGGIQDTSGYVQAIVDGTPGNASPTDAVLAQFRSALGTAARRTRATTIGLAYFVKRAPPDGVTPLETVVVEVEHRSGIRANVFFPYTRDEEGRPLFGEPFSVPGTLQTMTGRR